ncbi:MAG: hypothetical protein ACKVP3_06960 [Hyphomicrobiaceae bacterium]
MPGRDGEGIAAGGLEASEAAQRIVAVRSNAILSLDKAETIAARRLRDLAIRLRDDDVEGGTDRAPFDADRHFRERLAERMAALGAEVSADESARPVPYAVSDALPLSALGLSMPLLPGAAPKAAVKVDALQGDEAATDPGHVATNTDSSVNGLLRSDAAQDDDAYPVFEPAVRLVDLINQQRTLVTRLADMSLAEDVEPLPGRNVTALQSGNVVVADIFEAPAAEDAPAQTRSDAEELFEAATHAAEPVREEHHDADDDALVPLAISAEQLIAALEADPSAFRSDEEPAPEEKRLAKLFVENRQPAEPRRDLADAEGEGDERAPMIIERARAEMAAIANSEAALRPARHSGAFGFFAGLSLSIAAGVVLYYTL